MLTVRHFEPKDYHEVLGIERLVFSDREAEEYVSYYFMQREHFFVAQLDTRVVGYAVGYVSGEMGKVFSIAVHPMFRGRGIGSSLMIRLLTSLIASGASYVMLEVRVSNYAAQRLYRKLGFTQIYRVPMYYPDGEDAYVYALIAPPRPMVMEES
ncbi:ribosomal protein S18-alanine N-acetyltransferase [Methermicoccus shengliensis]|uniref:Ribosomal protein S18-alanine N-acetyltransferase n=1 Tax=Methermicoccus shengliensis TaxID=660064 RepID=A0A832RSE0_9EURY|nr:ribosomal protein S18-alanine N-acetyltransferase [Methermicoccus shengliensis]KUK05179.1 MAG: Ribosomal-protein-alanine acetyltransferase [Euryarchaeota archaeon 55_53]KUK29632.1 MAG: Ribosomal-protein-alanine acetyltransferase [Methanosarcinales archeaon 56_1174]MDI3487339.1 [ribosomal protein S18]-alanine N-acetyltransferase [Methanosarcinales archaeon]MDN5294587.1 [ribosomal protein S18]-alanine N-acetyltransferase [Methanosarcinales archaeon]HIH69295.1 ribosomal protein S18-alanine N-a